MCNSKRIMNYFNGYSLRKLIKPTVALPVARRRRRRDFARLEPKVGEKICRQLN